MAGDSLAPGPDEVPSGSDGALRRPVSSALMNDPGTSGKTSNERVVTGLS
jgi:hypothetical protein